VSWNALQCVCIHTATLLGGALSLRTFCGESWFGAARTKTAAPAMLESTLPVEVVALVGAQGL